MLRASWTTSQAGRFGSASGSVIGSAPSRVRQPALLERVQLEQLAQHVLDVLARLDQVEHPVVEQELGGLEALRELLADGLLDHLRAGESDVRVRLGEQDVAERRERGAHAAVGRVGQQADHENTLLVQPGERGARLRHLHQREAALLHARPAGSTHHQQRRPLLERELRGACDALPHGASHGAADEAEVHHGDHERLAADRRRAVREPLAVAGLALRLLDPLRVRLGVREAERVERLEVAAQILEAALVQQLLEARRHRDAEVVVALRADAEIALQALVVDERVTGGAPRPLDVGAGLRRRRRLGHYQASRCRRRCSSRERASAESTCERSGSLPLGLAEDLRDHVGEDVGRAAGAVDARGVDGQVERASPVLAAKLDLDQAVERIHLVRRVVVHRPQALEGGGGLVQPAHVERELGELEHGERIIRLRLRHRRGGVEGVLRASRSPVDGRDRPQRVDVPRLALERLAEELGRVVRVPRSEREVAEVDQRRGVVRIGLDRALQPFARALEIACFETGPGFLEGHSASASQV